MRSISVTLSTTLDGVVQGLGRRDEGTRGGFDLGSWGNGYSDDVMAREMGDRPGDRLFGRRIWEDFATAWGPRTDGNPYTAHLNAATK
ncbi:hypothetical protein F9C11_06100 [Amycolatopsis sp. VS8301801F10]|uniref:hypothetical protein n=1 Tax=Amycolatopsis sp. VS8301801F10 TaxID=2652442 RepID=UPI0038FCD398